MTICICHVWPLVFPYYCKCGNDYCHLLPALLPLLWPVWQLSLAFMAIGIAIIAIIIAINIASMAIIIAIMAIYHCQYGHLSIAMHGPLLLPLLLPQWQFLLPVYGHDHCHYDHLCLPCMAISIPLLLQVWQLLLPFIASYYCHYYGPV